jgi:hypothetical protein
MRKQLPDNINVRDVAVLTHVGAEGTRTREIALWSIAAGLLIAILGDAVIAILRSVVVPDSTSNAKG